MTCENDIGTITEYDDAVCSENATVTLSGAADGAACQPSPFGGFVTFSCADELDESQLRPPVFVEKYSKS